MIQSIPWDLLLKRISERVRFLDTDRVDPYDLLTIMMNKENYLVAMFDKKVFNIGIPGIRRWRFTTKIFEVGLRYILDANVFNESGQVREEYLNFSNHSKLAAQLRAQFKFIGIFGFLVSPFIFVALLVYLLISYADALKFSPNILSLRTWTPIAKWRFRDYNEVQYIFENRLARAHGYAEKYVDQFTNPILETVKKFAIFIFATMLTPLLILSVIREDFLVSELIFGRSVLYIIGLLGGIIAMMRKTSKDADFVYDPQGIMENLVKHTHYFNENWVKTAGTKEVQKRFDTYFQLKIFVYLTEALSIFLTPLVFYFSLSESANDIVSFIYRNTEVRQKKELGSFFKLSYKGDYKNIRSYANYEENYASCGGSKMMNKDIKEEKVVVESETMLEVRDVQRKYENVNK